MPNTHKRFQSFLGVFLATFSLTACVLSGGPENGKVIDATTNTPVEDAIVVARWIGHLATWAHGSTNCYHVESTTTDKNGEFHIPKWEKNYTEDWQKNISPRYVDITAYKPGYQLSPRQIEEQSPPKGIYYIEPFKGSREERLEYLLHLSGLVGCRSAGDEKTLIAVYKSLYDEAKTTATSDDDKSSLQIIRRHALYAWSRPPRELTSHEIEQAIQSDPYLREQFK